MERFHSLIRVLLTIFLYLLVVCCLLFLKYFSPEGSSKSSSSLTFCSFSFPSQPLFSFHIFFSFAFPFLLGTWSMTGHRKETSSRKGTREGGLKTPTSHVQNMLDQCLIAWKHTGSWWTKKIYLLSVSGIESLRIMK